MENAALSMFLSHKARLSLQGYSFLLQTEAKKSVVLCILVGFNALTTQSLSVGMMIYCISASLLPLRCEYWSVVARG